jgi:cell division septum initiation protein DivIVA
MKESKLVELKNKVKGLTSIVKKLIQEIQINATLAQGTLTAFQYHLGKKKWEKLINELKDKEQKMMEKQKQKSTNFTEPKLEIPKEK